MFTLRAALVFSGATTRDGTRLLGSDFCLGCCAVTVMAEANSAATPKAFIKVDLFILIRFYVSDPLTWFYPRRDKQGRKGLSVDGFFLFN